MPPPSSSERETIDTQLKILQTYADGKMKRYGLLFSVNGGAFALARWSSEKSVVIDAAVIAAGTILFTILVPLDIWMFGIAMRTQFDTVQDGLFGQHGRLILLGLALFLIAVGSRCAFPALRLGASWCCCGFRRALAD